MALLSRRKRKRKKKLPKTSSACGRARRRQRQWHARDAGFPGVVSPRAVFPLVADRPRCSTSWLVWNRRTFMCSSMLLLALCFLPCLQARDARHHVRFGPEGFWHVQGLMENFTFFYVYWWITDPEVDSRPSLFPHTAQCLVRPWIHILRQSTENFKFFYVDRWITDPEVDSRPSLFPYTAQCLVRPWIQVLRQSTENFRLFCVFGWTRLLRTILVLLCGFPVPQILEQIVEVSLFSMRLLDRLMTCPLACRFLGPCTQVHGRADPRHQGGERVAGTPGACSQVFCHPIRCI